MERGEGVKVTISSFMVESFFSSTLFLFLEDVLLPLMVESNFSPPFSFYRG
jgi:hypothetical protein